MAEATSDPWGLTPGQALKLCVFPPRRYLNQSLRDGATAEPSLNREKLAVLKQALHAVGFSHLVSRAVNSPGENQPSTNL